MKAKWFLFWMLAICFAGCGPEEPAESEEEMGIELDGRNFPDDVFRTYLEANFDADGNGLLNDDEILAVDTIRCDGLGIYALDKIAEFVNLRYLSCKENRILELDLSKNTNLSYLDCSNNFLVDLDVSGSVALEYLDCSSTTNNYRPSFSNGLEVNRLESLDLSNNPALVYLDCSWNQLTSLSLSKDASLDTLICVDNQRYVNVNSNKQFDLSQLPGFDVSRAYDWVGGTVDGTILTFNGEYSVGPRSPAAKYSYQTGLPGYDVVLTLFYNSWDLK